MDGRTCAQLLLLSSLAALGCRSKETAPANPLPSAPNMIDRALNRAPAMPSAPVVYETAADANKPIKPETIAVMADVQVAAAFQADDIEPAERERRLDEARQRFQKALQQDPKNLDAHRGLGRLYTRLGDRDRALQSYKQAMTHHPRNHAIAHEAAMCCGRFEDWQAALELWQHAQSIDPDNRKYPRMIGLAHARLGNYEAGFNSLVKVVSEAEARTVMARELMEAGHAAAAKEQLDLALKIDPNFAPAQQMLGVQQASHGQ
jgi:tetratricopeptide (TPR) repeat protein